MKSKGSEAHFQDDLLKQCGPSFVVGIWHIHFCYCLSHWLWQVPQVAMSESSFMSAQHSHSNFPKLHNAMWPGLVGKGSPGAESTIDLDTMLELTANARVDGIGF